MHAFLSAQFLLGGSAVMVMEFHNLNSFSIYFITSFLFLFALFKLVQRSSCNNYTTKLPPGPRKLPIIGNLYQLVGSQTHHCLKILADKHGPLMHLKLGEVSNIIVTSPEMTKEIIKTHDLNFSDRPYLPSSKIVSYNATNISFAPHGDYWRQLRKICTVELLTAKRVQSFRSIREEEVSELLKKICACEGSIFNLSQNIYPMTYGIAARAAFGKKCRYQEKFISKIEEQLKLIEGFSLADLYPSSRVLQMMAKGKLEKVHGEIDRMLQDIIDEHKSRKSRHQTEAVEDLVDVLLKFQPANEMECPLTDENIKAVIQDMFVGGGETSSAVVEWGMSEMIRNPKVMEAAQAEVRRVFDSKEGYVDESEVHQLVYLKSIIKETLRLHPSVPLLIPRVNRARCHMNGYEIPAKSRVIVNAWAIGRNPKYWNEAERFKPERFLNSSIDFKGTDFEFVPFGTGRRICPGITFAIHNIELPLAQLLYHFNWKLPNNMKNEELDMTEAYGIILRRQNDLCLIPITRSS